MTSEERQIFTAHDINLISRDSGLSIRTAQRAAAGRPVSEESILALKKSAARVRKKEDYSGQAAISRKRRPAQTSWDLQTIRAARDAQQQGDFAQPAKLAKAIKTDDAIFTALNARLDALSALAAELKPATSRGVGVKNKALASVIAPRNALREFHETLVQHGIAIGWNDIVPDGAGAVVSFRFRNWPLEWVKFNESNQRLETQVEGGLAVPIQHGDGFWVVAQVSETTPWCDGAINPASMVWGSHAEGIADWASTTRSIGMAKIIGELPAGIALMNEDGTLTKEAQAFLELITDLNSGEIGAGIRPSGAKTDWTANNASGSTIFEALTNNRERAAARIYTGTDAILGSNSSSPGVDISQLFGVATTKIQGDAIAIADALNIGVYQPWAAMNEGDTRLSPAFEFILPNPDRQQEIDNRVVRWEKFHAIVKGLHDAGISPGPQVLRRIAEDLNLPADLLVTE